MKWAYLFLLFGYLLVAEGILPGLAAKQFRDVMPQGRLLSRSKSRNKLNNWSSDHNTWNVTLYPHWKVGDRRLKNCWRGGKVVATLTSDSPALVGSNMTFSVILKYPRCQSEDNDGNIIYDIKCANGSSAYSKLPNQYIYNWTQWIDYCGWKNCSYNNSYNVFPDGTPFPYDQNWRRKNFVYVFHTLGQYFQKTGGSSAVMSINTTNITVGQQLMEVSVYRRGYRSFVPVTSASIIYFVTNTIPMYVNISQKNDRNTSDYIFIKDIPVTFDVHIHDPSHYLNNSVISYNWDYGDGSGVFGSNSSLSTHTYTLSGNVSLHLSVQAMIPGPCGPVTPQPPLPPSPTPTPTAAATTTRTRTPPEQSTEWPTTKWPTTEWPTTEWPTTTWPTTEWPTTTWPTTEWPTTEWPTTEWPTTKWPTTEWTFNTTALTNSFTELPTVRPPPKGCRITRYGIYNAPLFITEGILGINIIQMTSVPAETPETENSMVDFMVTCQGSLPTDACTIIADPTCQVLQSETCNPVHVADVCLLTIRRVFNESGTYCVNITLGDAASLALASALISVGDEGSFSRTAEGALIASGFMVVFAAVLAFVLYNRRYKQYKPAEQKKEQETVSEGLDIYFNNVKTVLFPANSERDPLLKSKIGIV